MTGECIFSSSYFQDKVDNLLENYYAALESESCMDRSDDDIGVTLSSVRLLILTTSIAALSSVLFCLQDCNTQKRLAPIES